VIPPQKDGGPSWFDTTCGPRRQQSCQLTAGRTAWKLTPNPSPMASGAEPPTKMRWEVDR
jgi:hypothetical protein